VTLTNGVSVSGSVNVTNTPANPVPVVGIVDVVPRQPYQEFGITTIPVNLGNNFINFPTPAGKRYVIEFVSVACQTQSLIDSFPQVKLEVTKQTSSSSTTTFTGATLTLNRTQNVLSPGTFHSAFATVKLYSDAGLNGSSGIHLNIFHTDAPSANCSGVVSGYTVDL